MVDGTQLSQPSKERSVSGIDKPLVVVPPAEGKFIPGEYGGGLKDEELLQQVSRALLLGRVGRSQRSWPWEKQNTLGRSPHFHGNGAIAGGVVASLVHTPEIEAKERSLPSMWRAKKIMQTNEERETLIQALHVLPFLPPICYLIAA